MLYPYNDRARQMKNEVRGDLLVGSMEQQRVTKSPVVKKHRDSPKKCQSPQSLLIQAQMTQNEKEEQEQPQKVP